MVTVFLTKERIYKLKEEISSVRNEYYLTHDVFPESMDSWDNAFPELEEFYQGLLNTISDESTYDLSSDKFKLQK